MKDFTGIELAEIKELEYKLHNAIAHSEEAVAIGKKIREIDHKAYLRRRATITPAQDRAMKQLSKQLGIN